LIIVYWCVLFFVILKAKFTNKWLQHGTAVLLLMQISIQSQGISITVFKICCNTYFCGRV